MNYKKLIEDMNYCQSFIEEILNQNVDYCNPTLTEAANHLLKAKGERIRSFITFQIYHHYHSEFEPIIPAAAALELFNTFILIHDDIIDQDPLRLGIASVHNKWGIPMAILAGDVLHAQGFKLLDNLPFSSETKLKIHGFISSALIKTCEGQSKDITFEERQDISEDDYISMIRLKKAEMISLAARIGAISANADESEYHAFSDFGYHFGMTFQIANDILGIIADKDKIGKQRGNDIRQGKKTFIIHYAINHLPSGKKTQLKEILAYHPLSEDKLDEGIQLLYESGAIEAARAKAHYYANLAKEDLKIFNSSQSITNLKDLVDFTLSKIEKN